ncbi:MAG: NAD(P)H-hydrate dehydratase [Clostridiaceae bacterium]|jgi:hydroxyethylthiazole kinase-like uncharacterized protein yjeF|nr:NAD(P)H-hydrate dehydratase [Bacillota bacterium]NLI38333.1 NAD(P)H-hydrate dehydratase [Clostridiaceae bacterium]
MKLITPEQMRIIDQEAIEKIGIPGVVLMENAAFHVSMKAAEILNQRNGRLVLVVAGAGNNGGDAFAVSRHLLSMGYWVSLYMLSSLESLKGDAAINANILKNMGFTIELLEPANLDRFCESCMEADLVIDGLFGTGLSRDLEGIALEVVDIVNQYSGCTLSIDIPSGIDGLTGRICGSCVKADYTVTFFLPKVGMVQYPGAAYLGELTVADISIPYALADDMEMFDLTDGGMVSNILPPRPEDGHKGTFGKVLVIAGSYAMPGAAILCAQSAYRMGSGLVKLAVPREIVPVLAARVTEAVYAPMESRNGHIVHTDSALLKELLDSCDSVLVGPGLSCNEDTRELVHQVIDLCRKPLVLDADALNVIVSDTEVLSRLKCEAVITPHPAEMARLLGTDTKSVQSDRIGAAKAFAEEYGLTVVLKGAGTVIAGPDGRVSINPTGNNGMATAGSGDVLAGMIASLMGQDVLPYEAAVAAVFIHGLAGDRAAAEKGVWGMTASEISERIGAELQAIWGDR